MILASSLVIVAALQADAPPARVTVEPSSIELAVDASHQLRAVAYDSAGSHLEATFRWFSTTPEIVAVNDNGLVTALRPGAGRVAAVFNRTAQFVTITVPQLPPASLEVSLPLERVLAGTSVPLNVLVQTRIGDTLSTFGVSYTSSSERVASVDDAGRVFGRTAGTTTVRAAAGDVDHEIQVRVVDSPVQSYRLELTSMSVRTGDVVRLRVLGETSDGWVSVHFKSA